MAKDTHVVRQGETLASIARDYGFESFAPVWNAPENAPLRARRENPHVLLPGDSVVIPEKQTKTFSAATGTAHTFTVNLPPLEVRLVLEDAAGAPLRNRDLIAEADGVSTTLRSDGDGSVTVPVSSGSRSFTLSEAAETEDSAPDANPTRLLASFAIGDLDPVDEESGLKARLVNMGYLASPPESVDSDDELELAVEEFQCDAGLKVIGVLDAQTIDQILKVHGS